MSQSKKQSSKINAGIEIIKVGPEKVMASGRMHEIVIQEMQMGDKIKPFEFVRRAPGTRIIALSKDKEKLLLTKEYRAEHRGYDYRLPGGKVFDDLKSFKEYTGDILKAAEKGAIKEAEEEAGIKIEKIKLIQMTKCGASVEWDLYYFEAEKYKILNSQKDSGEGENIEVVWMGVKEVEKLILNGHFQEDRSAAVLLRYLNKLKN
jgi:8-oxo-dGTP pyrophosphatase MutT (NUDIX family)